MARWGRFTTGHLRRVVPTAAHSGPLVKHLTEANKLLRQLKALPATLRFMKVDARREVDVYSFADASFNIAAGL